MRMTEKGINDNDANKELVGLLTAISIVSKRLATNLSKVDSKNAEAEVLKQSKKFRRFKRNNA